MARLCRECKEPVSWGMLNCPRCGTENPSGANPGDVAIITGIVAVSGFIAYSFVRSGNLQKLLEGIFGLFSN